MFDIENVTEEQLKELYQLAYDHADKFSGMTYAQGLQAMIDVIQGHADIQELIDDYS